MRQVRQFSQLLKLALVVGGLTLNYPSLSWAQNAAAGSAGSSNMEQGYQGKHHHHRGQFKLVKACLAQQGISLPARTVGQRPAFSSLDDATKTAMHACFVTVKQDMKTCVTAQGITMPSRGAWSTLDSQTKSTIKSAKKTCRTQVLASFSTPQTNGNASGSIGGVTNNN